MYACGVAQCSVVMSSGEVPTIVDRIPGGPCIETEATQDVYVMSDTSAREATVGLLWCSHTCKVLGC